MFFSIFSASVTAVLFLHQPHIVRLPNIIEYVTILALPNTTVLPRDATLWASTALLNVIPVLENTIALSVVLDPPRHVDRRFLPIRIILFPPVWSPGLRSFVYIGFYLGGVVCRRDWSARGVSHVQVLLGGDMLQEIGTGMDLLRMTACRD